MDSLSKPVVQALQLASATGGDALVKFTLEHARGQLADLAAQYRQELADRIKATRREVADEFKQSVDQLKGKALAELNRRVKELEREVDQARQKAQADLAGQYATVIESLKKAETFALQKQALLGALNSLGLDQALARAIASGEVIETARGYVERFRAATGQVLEDVQHIPLDDAVLSKLFGGADFAKEAQEMFKGSIDQVLTDACYKLPPEMKAVALSCVQGILNGKSPKDIDSQAVSAGVIALVQHSVLPAALTAIDPKAGKVVTLLDSLSDLKDLTKKPKSDFGESLQTATAAVAVARQAAALIGNEDVAQAVEDVSKAVSYAQTGYQLYQTAVLIGATGGVGAVFAGMSFLSGAGGLAALGGTPGGGDSNAAVMSAIGALRQYMEEQFKEIKQQLAGLKKQLDGIEWTVNQLRADVAQVQWTIDVVHQQIGILSLQSAQDALAIAENTDQNEFIRYLALMTLPTMPSALDLSMSKHWLVSRVDDAFDRLRIVKAEAAGVSTTDEPLTATQILSLYLQAFLGLDEGGASAAFPVDALVRALTEFEASTSSQESEPRAQGAGFLRPLHKGIVFDAIERYHALLEAEARWIAHSKDQRLAVPAVTREIPRRRVDMSLEQRRMTLAHVAAFERGLSAAESLVHYLEGPKDGHSMLQRLMLEADNRAKLLVEAFEALEGFALTRVLMAWAGDEDPNRNLAYKAVDELKALGVDATESDVYAVAAYYHVDEEIDRVGTYCPVPTSDALPAPQFSRFANLFHEEGPNFKQPYAPPPFRIRINGGSRNSRTNLHDEMVGVRAMLDLAPTPPDRLVLKGKLVLDYKGYSLGVSLDQSTDFPFVVGYAAELSAKVNQDRRNPFYAWNCVSYQYLDIPGNNAEEKNSNSRPHLPHHMLRNASIAWTAALRARVQQLHGWALADLSKPVAERPISVAVLLWEAPVLVKPMLQVLHGSVRRAVVAKALQDDSNTALRELNRTIRARARDLADCAILVGATLAYVAPSVYQAADGLRELLDPLPWRRKDNPNVGDDELGLRLPSAESFEKGGFQLLQAMASRYIKETPETFEDGECPAFAHFRPLVPKDDSVETIDLKASDVGAIVNACMAMLKEAVKDCEEAADQVGKSFRLLHSRSLLKRMRDSSVVNVE